MRPLADQKLIAPAHPADSPFDAPPRVAQVRLYARPEVPFVERVARLALGVSMFLTHMVYYGMLSHYVTSMRWQRGPPMIRSMFALRHWRSEALIPVRVAQSVSPHVCPLCTPSSVTIAFVAHTNLCCTAAVVLPYVGTAHLGSGAKVIHCHDMMGGYTATEIDAQGPHARLSSSRDSYTATAVQRLLAGMCSGKFESFLNLVPPVI